MTNPATLDKNLAAKNVTGGWQGGDFMGDLANAAPALTGVQTDLADTAMNRSVVVTLTQLLSGYSDGEGDALSISGLVADHGRVHDNGDNTYIVTPASGYTGTITLSYNVSDGQDSVAATQNVDVATCLAGSAERVNSFVDGFQGDPNSTWLAGGSRVVTWTGAGGDDNGTNEVFFQLFNSDGQVVGDETQVNAYSDDGQVAPDVTALSSGGFVIAWASDGEDGSDFGIFFRRFDSDGQALDDNDIQVNTTTTGNQASPVITALGEDRFLVAWESGGEDGSNFGIYGRLFDADGSAVDDAFLINSTTNGAQHQPCVTRLADGGFAVTWAGNGPDAVGEDIFLQRFNSAGAAVDGEVRVNSTTAGDQGEPALTALADGGYVVTWQTEDANGLGVHAQRFNSLGQADGAEFAVNTTTANDQRSPRVVALPNGGWAVAWQSGYFDWDVFTSYNNVYFQLYDADGNATGGETRVTDVTSIGWEAQIGLLANETGFTISWTGNPTGDWAHPDVWQRSYTTAGLPTEIVGTAGDDTLDGTGGSIQMTGLAGDDSYSVDGADDVIVETSGNGTDMVTASINYALGNHVENLTLAGSALNGTGNGLNNIIIGTNGANELIGGDGDDELDGGAGHDNLTGGSGNDTYHIDSDYDTVFEDADAGIDQVIATFDGDVNFTLYDYVENFDATSSGAATLSGNDANNAITVSAVSAILNGGDGDDTLTSTAAESDDLLTGGGGSDVVSGGAGDDTYIIGALEEQVVEDLGAGSDTVQTYISLELAANVENLTYLGSDSFEGIGNGLANIISGGNGNDTLSGGLENDTLNGSGGNDLLDGGGYIDTMRGGTGDDRYYVDITNDVIVEDVGDGHDAVTAYCTYSLANNVEDLYLQSDASGIGYEARDGYGNGLANTIYGTFGGNGLFGDVGADTLYGLDGEDTLNGGAGNDTLSGGDDGDQLTGGTGADSLDGGAGNDTYYIDDAGDVIIEPTDRGGNDTVWVSAASYSSSAKVEFVTYTGSGNFSGTITPTYCNVTITGGAGNDSLTVNLGNDTLSGGDGDDVLSSGGNRDTLFGGDGHDWLDGGNGVDTMTGGAGNDTYVVNSDGETVTEVSGGGTDTVRTSELASYTLGSQVENLVYLGSNSFIGVGNSLANTLIGGDGDDSLDGRGGIDAMTGGLGNDSYAVDDTGDTVTEGDAAGSDTIYTIVNYTLSAHVENLVFQGSSGLSGIGNGLDNTICGNSGANSLDGGFGADSLWGGNGNDTFYVDQVGDSVYEASGEGTDTVHSTVAAFTLGAYVENLVLSSGHISGTGNGLANTITGSSGNNVIDGGSGADSMAGGAGNDIYVIDNVDDVVVETSGNGTDEERAAISWTLSAHVENLVLAGAADIDGAGNAISNRVTGNSGDNVLNGLLGADTMTGGDGDDTYYVDNLGDQVTENEGEGSDTIIVSRTTWVLANHVENMVFRGSQGFNGTGNALSNRLAGGRGSDTLAGGDGNDALNGGAANDDMSGGAGNDTYYVDSAGDTVTEAEDEGIDAVRATVSHTLSAHVENLILTGEEIYITGTGNDLNNRLIGNAYANTLRGLDGNDIIDGGQGADTMYGGNGNDVYYVDDTDESIQELDDGGVDTVYSDVTVYLNDHIEKLILTETGTVSAGGNEGDNWITGNSSDNDLSGYGGIDVLDGGLGDDTLAGGEGDDKYYVDSADDVIVEAEGEGTDTVRASVTYTLGDHVETLVLTGSALSGTGNALSNRLSGNAGNNHLYGMDGNDMLNGGLGDDTLIGGDGNDLFYVDSADDVIVEADDGGTDQVRAGTTYTLGDYVERLTLTGDGDITGTGNGMDNMLTGNGGTNTLYGLGGNDVLNGMAGADVMIGGDGNDKYYADMPGDVIVETEDGGTDVVYAGDFYELDTYVENLIVISTTGSTAYGNDLGNVMTGGVGTDHLNGLNGNDTLSGGLSGDSLNGGAGDDLMTGGLGNDTYHVDSTGDRIREYADGGRDSVYSDISLRLSTFLDDLYLTGTADINGTGNATDNTITGNSADNRLTGGLGADLFAFYSRSGDDVITDFNLSQNDRLSIEASEGDASINQSGLNVTISLTDGSTITVLNAAIADITADGIITWIN